MEFLKEFYELIQENQFVSVFVKILLAVIAGGIIGNERGRHGSAAGLRTHILVCIGSAMTSLTGMYVADILGSGDVLRIPAQVISGIGFLGAGMIIVKNNNVITGLTTAAGLWATAAIGISVGYGFYWGAFVATLACFFTATFLTRFERKRKMSVSLYVEINEPKLAGQIYDNIKSELPPDALIEAVSPKSGLNGNMGLFMTFSITDSFPEFRKRIEEMEGVTYVIPE